MNTPDQSLTPNQLSFLAIASEYCRAVESAGDTDAADFVDSMIRLLPRIYITVSDMSVYMLPDAYIPAALGEDYYDSVRRAMEMLLGEDDTYLEVFEEDMKYSDTPIAASISEGLADIFQVLYNMLEAVKDAPYSVISDVLAAVREDFGAYWSRPLCNVLRAINAIKYR